MLTGNLYQYYTNLRNSYNVPIKILTGNIDVDYKILHNLKVHDLSIVCRSNKYAQQLCNNNVFWFKKFRDENLPLFAECTHLAEWLLLYKNTQYKFKDATDSLKVHKINAVDKLIHVKLLLPDYGIINSILHALKMNVNILILDIYISLNDNLYDFVINDGEHNMILNKDDLISFLTGCYMYPEDCSITCENLPLIVTDENIDHYLENLYEESKYIIYTRKGILDCIRA